MANKDDILEPLPTSLTDLGLDESWLEKWLQSDPKRLSLGSNVRIVRSQVNRAAGATSGRLDIQAVDEAIEDRVYDIELMRGELDADHGFRALDYWAREQKADDSDREHRPVIVAERMRGSRYWTLLEVLAKEIGLIALEIRCAKAGDKTMVWLDPVILPRDLVPVKGGDLRFVRGNLTEQDWRAKTTDKFWTFLNSFRDQLNEWGLKHNVVWSVNSYIGLWKGSRCWCPIWERKEMEGRVYLPAPKDWSDSSAENPPKEFEVSKVEFLKHGIDLVWTEKYNAGANPVALTLKAEHFKLPIVKDFLSQSWHAI